MQAKGLCKPCYDKHLKMVNPTYRQAQSDNTSRWYKRFPEKAKAIGKRRQEKEKNDPLERRKRRSRGLMRKDGITADDYDVMLLAQGGGCALCGRKPRTYLHVDHDHETNVVRGLLCHQCNWYMGTIDADPTILTKIAAYRNKTN